MLYADGTGTGLCIATEEGGETLCGQYTAKVPIEETVDDVWELFDGHFYEDCSCRERLIEYLGFENEEQLNEFRRKRRAIQTMNKRRCDD